MKRLRNVIQKITISILIVLSFCFITPIYSHADDIGGVLAKPVVSFLAFISDTIMGALQHFMVDGGMPDEKGVGSSEDEEENDGIFDFMVDPHKIPDPDEELKELEKNGQQVQEVTVNGDNLGGFLTSLRESAVGGYGYEVPNVKYSPEKIFSGQIPALNVNFIAPQDGNSSADKGSIVSSLRPVIAAWYVALRNLAIVGLLSVLLYVGIRMIISSTSSDKAKYKQMLMDWVIALCIVFFMHYIMSFTLTVVQQILDALSLGNDNILVSVNGGYTSPTESAVATPDLIDAGLKIDTLIKSIESNTAGKYLNKNSDKSLTDEQDQQNAIKRYKVTKLKNFIQNNASFFEKRGENGKKFGESLIEMYIGLIDGTSINMKWKEYGFTESNPKYYFQDEAYWNMYKSFINLFDTNEIFAGDEFRKNDEGQLLYSDLRLKVFTGTERNQIITNGILGLTSLKDKELTTKYVNELNNMMHSVTRDAHVNVQNGIEVHQAAENDSGESKAFLTNLMGLCRFKVQSNDFGAEFTYLIMYIALVIYTVMFTWKYVKRTITMAFLTLMAPLVALTYPIDKLNDGKAQGFSTWLKEYIYNALLQPFHLILYTIFVSSAMDIAIKNPIYAILFLAFIGPAEKLLRKFFGFDKSATVGSLDTAGKLFGGAAAYNLASRALGRGGQKGGNGGRGGNGGSDSVRQKKSDKPIPAGGYEDEAKKVSSTNTETTDNVDEEKTKQIGNTSNPNASHNELSNEKLNAMEEKANALANDGKSTEQIKEELEKAGFSKDEISKFFDEEPETSLPDVSNIQELETPVPGVPNIQGTQRGSSNIDDPYLSARGRKIREGLSKTGKKIGTGINNSEVVRNIKGTKTWQEKFGNKRWWAQKGKGAAKLAAKGYARAAGAVGLGAIGIASGVVGDDLENVLQFGAGGIIAGGTVGGSKLINTGANIGNKAYETAGKMRYGDDWDDAKERTRRKNDENFRKQVQKSYAKATGRKVYGNELNDLVDRASEGAMHGMSETASINAVMYENYFNEKDSEEYNKEMDKFDADEKLRKEEEERLKKSEEANKEERLAEIQKQRQKAEEERKKKEEEHQRWLEEPEQKRQRAINASKARAAAQWAERLDPRYLEDDKKKEGFINARVKEMVTKSDGTIDKTQATVTAKQMVEDIQRIQSGNVTFRR